MDMSSPSSSWKPAPLPGGGMVGSNTSSTGTRKRPRSPMPPRGGKRGKVTNIPPSSVLASDLRHKDKRVSALNSILVASSSHEANYALGEHGEDVLDAMVSIVHECLQWKQQQFETNETYNATTTTSKTTFHDNDNNEIQQEDHHHYGYSFVASTAWSTPPDENSRLWAAHCQGRLAVGGDQHESSAVDHMKLLNVIVAILRNLSFVAANLRLLAHSPHVLGVLVGCLYDTGSGSSFPTSTTAGPSGGDEGGTSVHTRSNLSLHALQTLVHLAPYLDVTGQKLYADKMFLDPTKLDEQGLIPFREECGQALVGMMGWGGLHLARKLDTKEDVVTNVDPKHLLELVGNYLVGVWSIFPALARVMTDTQSPRLVIMVALDLLKELLEQASNVVVPVFRQHDDESEDEEEDNDMVIPNARDVLVYIPDAVLDRLVDLLWIPRLGPDSLEYLNPVNNIVSRVSTLKLLMGYDATVDTDLRDRALDVLVPLLELQSSSVDILQESSLTKRLGCQNINGTATTTTRTRLYDALVPLLTTSVGRNDAPNLASEVLVQLAKHEENRLGLAYIQERLLHLASRGDVRVAQLACNHLYHFKKQQHDDDDDKDDETKEQGGDNDTPQGDL